MEKSVELLRDCVSIYSTSGNESEVSRMLVDEMGKRGFDSFVDEAGNAVGKIGCGSKTILMVGHIDTYPGFIKVREKDGKLYGRGTVDAKGPFCAFISAAAKARLDDKNIIVVGAVEEESATSKGARHIIGKYRPDYIIIGEPSGYDALTLGYKGRLLVDYHFENNIFHTASENLGVIEEAFDFYYRLREKAKEFNSTSKGVFDTVQISLRNINSGSDGFIEHVDMMVGYRLPVGFDFDTLEKYIESIKGNAAVKIYGKEKAIRSGKNNQLVRAFLRSMRSNGADPKFKVKTGTSDMNVLGEAFPGIPIITYGPGDSALDHTPEEHIEIQEYLKSIEVLAGALESL